jgi:PPM family protein phosphatase
VVLAGRRVVGASVGDSQALLFTDTGHLALTSAQVRKPLLGSGRARLTEFEAPVDGGRLLIATDGLFNHASMDGIRRVILGAALPTVGPALVQLARLASGALPDDVGLVVVHLDVGARGGPGLTTQ